MGCKTAKPIDINKAKTHGVSTAKATATGMLLERALSFRFIRTDLHSSLLKESTPFRQFVLPADKIA
jgi:hypothetical protein